jgi:hypothetical protein
LSTRKLDLFFTNPIHFSSLGEVGREHMLLSLYQQHGVPYGPPIGEKRGDKACVAKVEKQISLEMLRGCDCFSPFLAKL